jgi:hypothetical protein
LCDVAKEVLERFAKEFPLEIQAVDIESDPDLFEKYRYEIPVVLIDGKKLFKYRIEEDRLRKVLTAKTQRNAF